MIPILAESLTPPPGFAAWLACLAFTVMLANQGLNLWNSARGKRVALESPVTVQGLKEFVSRSSYIDHCRHNAQEHRRIEDKAQLAVDTIKAEMKLMEREILDAGERRAEGIHNRLNDLARSLGRVEGNQA